MKNKNLFLALTLAALGGLSGQSQAQLQINSGSQYLMNQARDMSTDFGDFTNIFFFADELSSFDVAKASGTVRWKRYTLESRQAFNTNTVLPVPLKMQDFPFTAYVNDPELRFSIDFVSPRTVRVRMLTTPVEPKDETSLMLAKEPGKDSSWKKRGMP